jgi:hypothetical protein
VCGSHLFFLWWEHVQAATYASACIWIPGWGLARARKWGISRQVNGLGCNVSATNVGCLGAQLCAWLGMLSGFGLIRASVSWAEVGSFKAHAAFGVVSACIAAITVTCACKSVAMCMVLHGAIQNEGVCRLTGCRSHAQGALVREDRCGWCRYDTYSCGAHCVRYVQQLDHVECLWLLLTHGTCVLTVLCRYWPGLVCCCDMLLVCVALLYCCTIILLCGTWCKRDLNIPQQANMAQAIGARQLFLIVVGVVAFL